MAIINGKVSAVYSYFNCTKESVVWLHVTNAGVFPLRRQCNLCLVKKLDEKIIHTRK